MKQDKQDKMKQDYHSMSGWNDHSFCYLGLASPSSCRQTSWQALTFLHFFGEFFSLSGLRWSHFQASLGLHLLFFNLMGALWLVAREGIPMLITAYLIQVEEPFYSYVTSLNVEMLVQNAPKCQQCWTIMIW